MTTMTTFICIKNFPALGFIAGKRVTVKSNSEEYTNMSNMKEYFREEIPDDKKYHVGDMVEVNGYFKNLTHPKKSSTFRDKLTGVTGTITKIEMTGPDDAYVTITSLGGISYAANMSIIKDESLKHHSNNRYGSPTMKEVSTYWFINSCGVACRSIVDKNESRDNWCKLSGNCYNTQEEATKAIKAIQSK